MLTRRDLLARAGVAAGTLTVAGGGAAVAAEEATPPFDPRSWESVRKQFPIRAELAHLAAFVLAAHPAPVRAAIERHRRALDADPYGYLHRQQGRLEAAVRSSAATYLGGVADEVAVTDSTTMGLGLLYGGLELRPGDELLTTAHDFYATHEALRLAAARSGATVRRIELYRDLARVSADEIVESVASALTPRTRVVALTWVHSSTGLKLPVAAISQAVGGRAVVAVDAVHALGVEPIDVGAAGCDFVVAGCHKWLAGPRGTGIVWGRTDRWSALRATIPSFDDGATYGAWLGFGGYPRTRAVTMSPGGYHSFEHRWALREAFAFHAAIGTTRVAARIRTLAQRLKAGLAGIRGVAVVTPASARLSAGIVCIDVAGMRPETVVERLLAQHRVVASVTPYARPYVRFGPGLYTSATHVDAAVRAVAAVAR